MPHPTKAIASNSVGRFRRKCGQNKARISGNRLQGAESRVEVAAAQALSRLNHSGFPVHLPPFVHFSMYGPDLEGIRKHFDALNQFRCNRPAHPTRAIASKSGRQNVPQRAPTRGAPTFYRFFSAEKLIFSRRGPYEFVTANSDLLCSRLFFEVRLDSGSV